jgi:hypothetical protein
VVNQQPTLLNSQSQTTAIRSLNLNQDPLFYINSKLLFCDRELEFPKTLVDTDATNCFINFKFLPPDIQKEVELAIG